MAKFRIGDLVWARMKGFPSWPGRIIEPNPDVKRPTDKKIKHFVFFMGSENYAWVPEETIWAYEENRKRFMPTHRSPRALHDAVEAMEQLIKTSPSTSESVVEKVTDDDDIHQQTISRKTKAAATIESSPVGEMQSEAGMSKQSSDSDTSSPPPSLKRQRLTCDSPVTDVTAQSASVFDSSVDVFAPSSSDIFDNAVAVGDYRVSIQKAERLNLMPDVLSTTAETVSRLKHGSNVSRKIGFLGVGTIGSAVISNLLKSGHDITVWNRTTSKCREVVEDGATLVTTPCQVVEMCDITFSCVSDPSALKDLVFGNNGVLQGITAGKAYVDMSTVDVETMSDVCEAITARGGRFLEAPLVGNKQLACSGQLVVLAAGDSSVFDECTSYFQAISKRTFFLGETGLATRMKLVISMLVGTTLAGLSESLALAAKLGLNITDVLQVLRHSSSNSAFIREKGSDIAGSKFTAAGCNCKLSLMQKDLKLAINMSDAVDQPLHVGSAVNELFKKAKAKGYGDLDIAAVYRAADL